ncbi:MULTISPECIES: histidine kinase dimerization/phospho-acceptor domain-containing protein [Pseudomonas]|uniref:histidine kinase dimerization/phospho-acceptor domain-containing protein n=1 Tax=Pseudomonas TaxID=286 RepID=UPI00210C8157|nr:MULTISPECIES: histidine kinase dimerization/phospho-acceptor domain-containing protein [Pseudomonas]
MHSGAEAQRAFLDNMAHPLRTPLVGLHIQRQWLCERYAGAPDSSRILSFINQTSERMIHQANQLLTLARASTQGNAFLLRQSCRQYHPPYPA